MSSVSSLSTTTDDLRKQEGPLEVLNEEGELKSKWEEVLRIKENLERAIAEFLKSARRLCQRTKASDVKNSVREKVLMTSEKLRKYDKSKCSTHSEIISLNKQQLSSSEIQEVVDILTCDDSVALDKSVADQLLKFDVCNSRIQLIKQKIAPLISKNNNPTCNVVEQHTKRKSTQLETSSVSSLRSSCEKVAASAKCLIDVGVGEHPLRKQSAPFLENGSVSSLHSTCVEWNDNIADGHIQPVSSLASSLHSTCLDITENFQNDVSIDSDSLCSDSFEDVIPSHGSDNNSNIKQLVEKVKAFQRAACALQEEQCNLQRVSGAVANLKVTHKQHGNRLFDSKQSCTETDVQKLTNISERFKSWQDAKSSVLAEKKNLLIGNLEETQTLISTRVEGLMQDLKECFVIQTDIGDVLTEQFIMKEVTEEIVNSVLPTMQSRLRSSVLHNATHTHSYFMSSKAIELIVELLSVDSSVSASLATFVSITQEHCIQACRDLWRLSPTAMDVPGILQEIGCISPGADPVKAWLQFVNSI